MPALGALIAEPLYVLADTAVVGRLGTVPLGGLSVAAGLLVSGYSIFIFLAYGTTAVVARRLGAGDEAGAAHHAVQALWLATAIGAGLVVAGWLGADWLISLVGPAPDVAAEAEVYFRISLAGVPALLLVLAGTGYLRGLQDTRTPLVVAVVSAGANLAIEIVLIGGLGYGIGASALSTVLAQWGAAAVYLVAVARAVRRHDVSLRPNVTALRRVAAVSRDLFVRTVTLRAAFITMTTLAARLGTTQLAASEIAFALWTFLALTLDAIAIAAQAMVGRLLGAGDAAAARDAARRMLELGTVFGVAVGTVVLVARQPLAAVFSTDPEVVATAATLLVWVGAMQPLNAVVFVLDGVLIGAGDTRYLAAAGVVTFVVFLPAAVIAATGDAGTIERLWSALVLFMVARLVTLVVRFRRPSWQRTGLAAA